MTSPRRSITSVPIPQQPPYGIQPPPQVPTGLEILGQVDHILIAQKADVIEILLVCEKKNEYVIKTTRGADLFVATEVSNCCIRHFLRTFRPLVVKIADLQQREVMEVRRPLRCTGCLWPCCLQEVEVMAPPGTTVGYVIEEWSICTKFRVENAMHETVLLIDGPCFPCQCICNAAVVFRVLSKDGSIEVGRISKTWGGLAKEIFTDADNYGISFPHDMDISIKAVLIGAAFLIDYMFFEC